MLANGTFEVKLEPHKPEGQADPGIGRLSINKQFQGGLEGNSKGLMISVGTDVDGSAAYSAIERFNGELNEQSGSFALQHTGIMTRGAPQLTITVVPDSGTGQLAGITGTMTIDIMDGTHNYTFEFTLDKLG